MGLSLADWPFIRHEYTRLLVPTVDHCPFIVSFQWSFLDVCNMHHLLHQNKTHTKTCWLTNVSSGVVVFFVVGRLHFLTVGFDFVYTYIYTITCLPSPAFWVIFYLPKASIRMSPAIWAVSNLLVLECFAASCPRSEHLHAEEFAPLRWSIRLHLPAGVNWCTHSCWQLYELLGLFWWLASLGAIHLSLWRLDVLGTFCFVHFSVTTLCLGGFENRPDMTALVDWAQNTNLLTSVLGWALCF